MAHEQVTLRLNAFWVREKNLSSRVLQGEVLALTEKGIKVRAHALVGPSDHCHRCGKVINDPVSRLLGYGPECAARLGIPRKYTEADVERIKQSIERRTIEEWFPRKYAFDRNGRRYTGASLEAPPPGQVPLRVKLADDGNNLLLKFPYNDWAVEQVRNIPGRLWHSQGQYWIIPITQGEEVFSLYVELNGHEPQGDWVREMIPRIIARDRKVVSSKALDAEIEIDGLGRDGLALFPYQRAGVAYALHARRTFIADEMGLGKTVQAVAVAQAELAYPCVVVCPATPKINWQREFEKWVPGVTTHIIEGRELSALPELEVYIINYDLLPYWLEKLKSLKPECVIFDESHYLKNGQAQRSKAAEHLAEGVPIRLLLSGTAIKNNAGEILHQLKVLGRLDEFGGYSQFKKRYVDHGSAERDLELNERLRASCYVRREKREIYTELPPKRRIVMPLEISNRAEYVRAEKDIVEYLRHEAALEEKFLKSLEGLGDDAKNQAIKDYRNTKAYRARHAEHLVKFNQLKQLTAKGKLESVKEWIANFIQGGEKLVVFAHHQHVVRALADHFGCGYIDGTVTARRRQELVDQFQQDAGCRLLVLNLQAGGVAITLTAASNVAFVELPWTPPDIQQAEDRVYGRVNDLHGATSWFLLAANTVEETIAGLLDKKQLTTDAVNIGQLADPSEGIMAQLIQAVLKEAA